MSNWCENFKFIYNLFEKRLTSNGAKATNKEFCAFLEISAGKLQKWTQGQWPKAPDLAVLHDKFGLSYRWLVTGEGDPFDAAPAPVAAPAEQALPEPALPTPLTLPEAPHDMQPIPLVGFASCSVQGWYGTMTIPVPVEPPKWHDNMIAVMATGESMLPAGIGHGHICYCDPTKAPGVDEAVYVETMDGLGTIKLFCGWSERGGSSFLNLRGWLDKDPETDRQKVMTLDTAAFYIRRIAPVIYVRRRL